MFALALIIIIIFFVSVSFLFYKSFKRKSYQHFKKKRYWRDTVNNNIHKRKDVFVASHVKCHMTIAETHSLSLFLLFFEQERYCVGPLPRNGKAFSPIYLLSSSKHFPSLYPFHLLYSWTNMCIFLAAGKLVNSYFLIPLKCMWCM